MSEPVTSWLDICPLDRIVPSTGVAAKVGDKQVAIFRVGDAVYAIDNFDPGSGANVLSRGLVGDKNGTVKVASPIYKQNYDLSTGQCLDDPELAVATYPVQVTDSGTVQVGLTA